MSKLTLSVDEKVVERAKRYASQHGTSVSDMVEKYLDSVTRPLGESASTPVLRALRGSLKRGDVREYREHLQQKYLSR